MTDSPSLVACRSDDAASALGWAGDRSLGVRELCPSPAPPLSGRGTLGRWKLSCPVSFSVEQDKRVS